MRRLSTVLVLWATCAAVPALATADPPHDLRSVEFLRYGCANEIGRREVTLFANGTVRLRDGEIGKEQMGLAELAPDELQGFLNRLEGEDLSEVGHLSRGAEGAWVEKCELDLLLPGKETQKFRFGRYDALPLNLSRVVRIALDLETKVEDLKGSEQLPADYQPRLGDVLKRTDGQLFRVFAFTSDKRGVEMQGQTQPLTLYVLVEQLKREFVAVVSRRK